MTVMDANIDRDTASIPSGETPSWVSTCLSALLERHGVPSRHQATEIAHICAISVSQARRKLRGAVWLFDEVEAICRFFGESIDTVLANKAPAPDQQQPGGHARLASAYPATLLLDGQRLPCDIELGALCSSDSPASCPGFVAFHDPQEGWLVTSAARLINASTTGTHYAVARLQWRNTNEQARARIAVLDDDVGSATALADWFNEVGYEAHAYNRCDELLARPLAEHDAFVVDLILAGGQTSQALVERIRREQPFAPIVLLTGQLRDGAASEATLATILRTQGVTFFEKPVRPAVLTAAIQSGLDRLSHQHD